MEMAQKFAPAFLFPLVMLAFLNFRNKVTLRYLEKQKHAQNEMLLSIGRIIGTMSLIRDYKRRGKYIELFTLKVHAFNQAFTDSKTIVVNNKKFSGWCSLLVVAAYIVIGGMQVVDGAPLGAFLNNLAIYGALGTMWGTVYEVLLDMQNIFDSLRTIVEYMNLPTEDAHRMDYGISNIALVRANLDQIQQNNAYAQIDPIDQACIELRNLSFAYKSKGSIGVELRSSTAKLPQGGLYALVGPPSEGKGTILKLLGEVITPCRPGFERTCGNGGGDLVMPTHLRSIHVSKDPQFVEGTLLFNLTFGCKRADDMLWERVERICSKLGVPPNLIKLAKEDTMVADWMHVLSGTESALLHMARAFIANPEVLCLHKPVLQLSFKMADNIYKVLQEYVLNRGLELDPAKFHARRPRTCVVTARRIEGAAAAAVDAVFHVSEETGLKRIPKDELGDFQ